MTLCMIGVGKWVLAQDENIWYLPNETTLVPTPPQKKDIILKYCVLMLSTFHSWLHLWVRQVPQY